MCQVQRAASCDDLSTGLGATVGPVGGRGGGSRSPPPDEIIIKLKGYPASLANSTLQRSWSDRHALPCPAMQPRMGRDLFAAISARNGEVGSIEHTCCVAAATVSKRALRARGRRAPPARPSAQRHYIDELRLSSPARPPTANALCARHVRDGEKQFPRSACRRCTSRRTAALRPTSPSTGGPGVVSLEDEWRLARRRDGYGQ